MTPRWNVRAETNLWPLVFRGQAGPLDIWEDTFDLFAPFLAVYEAGGRTESWWCRDTERVIMGAKRADIHLTLHDQCRIHQICAGTAGREL
jgi:hypothetical protein